MKLTGGCNSYSAGYKAYQNGSFSIISISNLTKADCISSYVSKFLEALLNYAVSFEKTLNQFKLRDDNGITIIFTRVNQVSMVAFSGVFTSTISKNPLEFTFTKAIISIKGGCNLQNANYQAYSNGTITFGPFSSAKSFSSTQILCPNNQD